MFIQIENSVLYIIKTDTLRLNRNFKLVSDIARLLIVTRAIIYILENVYGNNHNMKAILG